MNGRKVSIVLILLVFTSSFTFSLMILPENVRAQTHYVGGSGPGNHTLIQDAVDASFPGDTVFVYNGTYYENVIVGKSLSLTGEGRDITTINGGGSETAINVTANWVNVTGFTITNGGSGILEAGLTLWHSSNCRVVANNVSSNRGDGIYGLESSNNTIQGNIVSSNFHGVYFSGSDDNVVTDNAASNNSFYGIILADSNRNFLSGNALSDNRHGIFMYASKHNVLKNNSMVNDGMEIASGGWFETLNTHDIDTSNTVNGKPVIYWKNATGGTIRPDAGQVFLFNSTDVLIENVSMSSSTFAVTLGYTSRIMIANLSISNVWKGLRIHVSDNVTVVNANITGTYRGIEVGLDNDNTTIVNCTGIDNVLDIEIDYSDYITIANNTLSGLGWGVYLVGPSRSNEITNNTIINEENSMYLRAVYDTIVSGNNISSSDNNGIELSSSHGNAIFNNMLWMNVGYGIRLEGSKDNKIYHNRFYGNGQNAYDDSNTSQWDNSYPSGGNYWSDYTGLDIKSGPNQTLPGSDGLGDVPYTIDMDSQDRFPLMDPHGSINTHPIASFTVSPPSGPMNTVFDFDASSSSDLEDSPSALEVRWDWEDDGMWDTPWSTNKAEQHQYPNLGTYTIRLEVKDTGDLASNITRQVSVLNTPPTASFEISPLSGNISTLFIFNASSSSDLENPTSSLEVRWDWEDDGTWDTSWSTTKMNQHQYSSLGTYSVRLEVMDTGGLINTTTRQVSVVNTPPAAAFGITPSSGNTDTVFEVDASSSSDLEDSITVLEARWDWEDDGTWDTGWSTTKTAQYQYSSPGAYTVHLEIRDTGGLISNTTLHVDVTAIPENSPPDCSILTPTQGETLSGTTTVEGWANDEENSDMLIEIRIDNGSWMNATGNTSWVYQWNTSTAINGNHTIYARAYDGERYSSVVDVTVIINNFEEPPRDHDGSGWTVVIIPLVILGVLVITLLLLAVLRKKKRKEEESESISEADSEAGP